MQRADLEAWEWLGPATLWPSRLRAQGRCSPEQDGSFSGPRLSLGRWGRRAQGWGTRVHALLARASLTGWGARLQHRAPRLARARYLCGLCGLPAWLSPFPDAGAGCLICVTSSGPCAPSALWASSWGSERLRSLCRASWDDPRPHSTPNPRPLRPRGALLASRVACPNPPLGCTRKCPLGASRMGPHLDSSPGHSDCLAGARPGHQPDSGPALRRPQSRPRRLRRGDPPSAASQGRGLDPRNRSVPQASLVVGAFLF